MFTTREFYSHFIGKTASWGLGLGLVLGAAFTVAIFLGMALLALLESGLGGAGETLLLLIPFLLPGALIGGITGVVLGLLLGLVLALVTRRYFYPIPDRPRYRSVMTITALITGLGVGFPLFWLTSMVAGRPINLPFFMIVPPMIAAGASVFAARRIADEYVTMSGFISIQPDKNGSAD